MRYRYYFYERYSNQLIEFLNKNNIAYLCDNEDPAHRSTSKIIFNIYSSSEMANDYLKELEKINVSNPVVFAEYSTKEYQEASFLVMRPKKQSIDILNEKKAYKYSCEVTTRLGNKRFMHVEQIGDLIIKKEPSINSRTAFWSESTGFAELFADYRILEMAQNNLLKGIEFKKVMLRNGNSSDRLFQVTSKSILKHEDIVLGYGEKVIECPICGKKQYCINNAYQLHVDSSKMKEDSDLYVTDSIFGEGIAEPLYIISQKFYQLLKKHKLANDIKFSPVSLI